MKLIKIYFIELKKAKIFGKNIEMDKCFRGPRGYKTQLITREMHNTKQILSYPKHFNE